MPLTVTALPVPTLSATVPLLTEDRSTATLSLPMTPVSVEEVVLTATLVLLS